MKIAAALLKKNHFETKQNEENMDFTTAQLVLSFGESELISDPTMFESIKNKFPNATILMGSSTNAFFSNEVTENAISLTALAFESATTKAVSVKTTDYASSFEAGKFLMKALEEDHLKLVLIVSVNTVVNGTDLIHGMNKVKKSDALLLGGYTSDRQITNSTLVGLNGVGTTDTIVAVGFYGEKLEVSNGVFGGCDAYGLERTITKSAGTIVYEIDGKSALEVYKKYMGIYAEKLNDSLLNFPIAIQNENFESSILRTVITFDETENSLQFGGDVPENSKIRFMRTNFNNILEAASDAAAICLTQNAEAPKLGIIISCIGRKAALGNRFDEEIEVVSEVFDNKTVLTGFYSFGEIAPLVPKAKSEFLNQVISIIGINERR